MLASKTNKINVRRFEASQIGKLIWRDLSERDKPFFYLGVTRVQVKLQTNKAKMEDRIKIR